MGRDVNKINFRFVWKLDLVEPSEEVPINATVQNDVLPVDPCTYITHTARTYSRSATWGSVPRGARQWIQKKKPPISASCTTCHVMLQLPTSGAPPLRSNPSEIRLFLYLG